MSENKVPNHIAIIMDGNRRWAKEKGLPLLEGHEAGAETFKKIAKKCHDLGVKILTVYAFSNENWNRSNGEVSYLMKLLEAWLNKQRCFFKKDKFRLNVIGQIERLPKKLQETILRITEETKGNTEGILNLALSYGGRQEIVDTVKKIVRSGIGVDKIDEDMFSRNLYTAGQSDPDLMIRTSGEQRTSGFLPWQLTYAELYFSPKYWPDFMEEDLEIAVKEYQGRQRRYGE